MAKKGKKIAVASVPRSRSFISFLRFVIVCIHMSFTSLVIELSKDLVVRLLEEPFEFSEAMGNCLFFSTHHFFEVHVCLGDL